MSRGQLVSITLERFKSYRDATEVPLSPLTVVIGRNNSGKSSIIQALLLLKQTLKQPRSDVPLSFDGVIEALHLRELTYGWPADGSDVAGPTLTLQWDSVVDIEAALETAGRPEAEPIVKRAEIPWFTAATKGPRALRTELKLAFSELSRQVVLSQARLRTLDPTTGADAGPDFTIDLEEDGTYVVRFSRGRARSIDVEFDHFLPYLRINKRNVGPRDTQRQWFTAWLLLYAQPIEDLRQLLQGFTYLGSMRQPPATLYKPATVAPEEVGVSGELAAQMLHARRNDLVQYLRPTEGEALDDELISEASLPDAVNDIFRRLGVQGAFSINDIRDVGFQLRFGQATLSHVGRGIAYLLPVVQLGLIMDPRPRHDAGSAMTRREYLDRLPRITHGAIEEAEAHLHPKVQSRLARWFVALARSGRQLIVETHSDHVVRGLRRLVASAPPGSELEDWLLRNVRIVEVTQDDAGCSRVTSSALRVDGSVGEQWPGDFMDEATDVERAIYDASLHKVLEPSPHPADSVIAEHSDDDTEPDPDADRA